LPYNIRHRLAEDLLPEAKRLGLGVVTIKALARGELLARPAAKEDPVGLARDMLAFVLENGQVDCCICGVHTEAHVRENFSASWTGLTAEARQRLARVAASGRAGPYGWLEPAWVSGQYC
jgi:aryl-alcohol dehydrogenase-like predicted oxidoreductase